MSEEPSAVIPHARVCEGGGSRPSYRRTSCLPYSEGTVTETSLERALSLAFRARSNAVTA